MKVFAFMCHQSCCLTSLIAVKIKQPGYFFYASIVCFLLFYCQANESFTKFYLSSNYYFYINSGFHDWFCVRKCCSNWQQTENHHLTFQFPSVLCSNLASFSSLFCFFFHHLLSTAEQANVGQDELLNVMGQIFPSGAGRDLKPSLKKSKYLTYIFQVARKMTPEE